MLAASTETFTRVPTLLDAVETAEGVSISFEVTGKLFSGDDRKSEEWAVEGEPDLRLALADIDSDGELDLIEFEGASSGLLGQSDYDEAGGALEPGASAAILLYENRWARPFAANRARPADNPCSPSFAASRSPSKSPLVQYMTPVSEQSQSFSALLIAAMFEAFALTLVTSSMSSRALLS